MKNATPVEQQNSASDAISPFSPKDMRQLSSCCFHNPSSLSVPLSVIVVVAPPELPTSSPELPLAIFIHQSKNKKPLFCVIKPG